jgi:copper chaperone CopZ
MIDTPKAIVHIRNMQTGDAVREVAEALLGVEGVSDVEMDEDQGLAVVDLVEGVQVTGDDLARAVNEAGYMADQISMPPGR